MATGAEGLNFRNFLICNDLHAATVNSTVNTVYAFPVPACHRWHVNEAKSVVIHVRITQQILEILHFPLSAPTIDL